MSDPIGNIFGIYNGINHGGVQGDASAIGNAASLASRIAPQYAGEMGSLGDAAGIVGGLDRGGLQGYGTAAIDAAKLANSMGWANTGALPGVGSGLMGLYSGLQQGGAAGDINAALGAANTLAGIGSLAGGTAAGGLGSLASIGAWTGPLALALAPVLMGMTSAPYTMSGEKIRQAQDWLKAGPGGWNPHSQLAWDVENPANDYLLSPQQQAQKQQYDNYNSGLYTFQLTPNFTAAGRVGGMSGGSHNLSKNARGGAVRHYDDGGSVDNVGTFDWSNAFNPTPTDPSTADNVAPLNLGDQSFNTGFQFDPNGGDSSASLWGNASQIYNPTINDLSSYGVNPNQTFPGDPGYGGNQSGLLSGLGRYLPGALGRGWAGMNSGQQLGSLAGLLGLVGSIQNNGRNMTDQYHPAPPPMFANNGNLPTAGQFGNFMGARARVNPTGIDYAHYGQGPAASWFAPSLSTPPPVHMADGGVMTGFAPPQQATTTGTPGPMLGGMRLPTTYGTTPGGYDPSTGQMMPSTYNYTPGGSSWQRALQPNPPPGYLPSGLHEPVGGGQLQFGGGTTSGLSNLASGFGNPAPLPPPSVLAANPGWVPPHPGQSSVMNTAPHAALTGWGPGMTPPMMESPTGFVPLPRPISMGRGMTGNNVNGNNPNPYTPPPMTPGGQMLPRAMPGPMSSGLHPWARGPIGAWARPFMSYRAHGGRSSHAGIDQHELAKVRVQGLLEGPGDGTSDSLQPTALSAGEYVVPAMVVSALGQGSNEAGARMLDRMQRNVRVETGKKMAKNKHLTGKNRAKSPEAYMKDAT